jgi:hypothetical protein
VVAAALEVHLLDVLEQLDEAVQFSGCGHVSFQISPDTWMTATLHPGVVDAARQSGRPYGMDPATSARFAERSPNARRMDVRVHEALTPMCPGVHRARAG